MDTSLLDNPLFLSIAFHPRQCERGISKVPKKYFSDGTFSISEETNIGYRLYSMHPRSSQVPCMIYFHGNAEIATDSDWFYDKNVFQSLNMNMISIDYRGYGWSDGHPTFSSFLPDVDLIVPQIHRILSEANIYPCPLVLWGRSIGSVCAVHIAHSHPSAVHALIIESGLSNLTDLPMVRQMASMFPGGDSLLDRIPDVFQQVHKLQTCEERIAVLVLHGEEDEVIPVSQAQKMFDSSVNREKRLQIFPGTGHNNLRSRCTDQWLLEIDDFLCRCLQRHPSLPDTLRRRATAIHSSTASRKREASESSLYARVSQAEELLLENRCSEAIEMFTEVVRHERGDETDLLLRVCHGRAQGSMRIGKYRDACDDYNTLLSINSNDTKALAMRMKCEVRLREWVAAEKDATMMIRLLISKKTATVEQLRAVLMLIVLV
mmetsp:Transcript_13481/g.13544  ORF Transcript_13481/g.13544 Transcript_13481/m.13544 type:complete len:433 (+) Transcript_13481:309-1607(+)